MSPNSDRFLEWSDENAALLKRKLEFHKGTPHELADEAQRLEKGFGHESGGVGWVSSDSKVMTLSLVLFLDHGRKACPEALLLAPADVEMQHGMPDYI